MRFFDVLLGRSRPIEPDLDRLFALPSAAVTLQAASGFAPTGHGSVCFATIEGAAFTQVREDVRALLTTGPDSAPVELTHDSYGYSWLHVQRDPGDLASLVTDLHAVNAALADSGFGPNLLCSLVGFEDSDQRSLALVYLYKRGTFYPFAPLPGNRRDNALELQIKAAVANELDIEQDLTRWFPLWGTPGL